MKKIGVCDTMFARGDMGSLAERTIIGYVGKKVKVERVTVPGFKDLPVAAKKLIEEKKCSIVLALGMAGKADIDEMCAHEASLGLIWAQLLTNTHIISAFVHENEAKNDKELASIMRERTAKHAINAVDMVLFPHKLSENAGRAKRQGFADEKWIEL